MQHMSVSEFKAHALEVMSRVAETKEGVEITKRGAPLVVLAPARPKEEKSVPGRLAGTMKIKGDIVSPLGEGMWEACR